MTPARARALPGRRPADALDAHIGRRMFEQRTAIGLSQQRLAAMIGVTYQQLHKYQTGSNRIAVGRLHAVAKALGVAPAWLYEGLVRAQPELDPAQTRLATFTADVAKIRSRVHQRAMADLTKALAA